MRQSIALFAAILLVGFVLPPAQPDEALAQTPERPNIVFVLTDDPAEKDLKLLPGIRGIMGDPGITFQNAYVTQSLCCPSRATFLRGQYPHNHRIMGNSPPLGGHDKFRDTGLDQSTFATWLNDAGYQTAFIGKYMNGYDEMYTPPGWDEWFAVLGSPKSQQYNDKGAVFEHSGNSTDLFADRTADFIRRASQAPEPFLAFVSTKAPHHPPDVAELYRDSFATEPLPRPPSFNEKNVSDKPEWVRNHRLLGERKIAQMERVHRARLASMLSVEDLLQKTVATLEETGELGNTYIFFASDNGFHLGQHRLDQGKLTAYEDDISIPLMVRGPGVPADRMLPHKVLNNDLAPTFAELAGVPIPDFVDGRSVKPLLTDVPPPLSGWRKALLVEGWKLKPVPPYAPEIPNYKGLRSANYAFVRYATGERELYYLPKDPYQLRSMPESGNELLYQRLDTWLKQLRTCAGDSCRAAENR